MYTMLLVFANICLVVNGVLLYLGICERIKVRVLQNRILRFLKENPNVDASWDRLYDFFNSEKNDFRG